MTLVSIAGLLLAALSAAGARDGEAVAGSLLAIALLWGALPLPIVWWARRRGARSARRAIGSDGSAVSGTVTVVVRVGAEPVEVAAASIRASLRHGPTAVISAQPLPDALRRLGAPVYVEDTVEAALASAAEDIGTDAVIVVSARTIPRLDACRSAAARLAGDVGWVTGTARPLNDDGYAPLEHAEVGAALRDRARDAGLWLWEPDATVLRTDLLRDHPVEPGRPWGSWLRRRTVEGRCGERVDEVLALRAVPVGAGAFWPESVARHRAATADLADAARSGSVADRVLAAGLLSRELFGFSGLCWAGALLGVAGAASLPFRTAPSVAALGVAVVLVARWALLRRELDRPLRPGADLLSGLHHLPASLASLPAAMTGRLRPSRYALPARPLVWAALLLTVLVGVSLVDQTGPTGAPRLTVGLALAALALLWTFTMRALMQRNWDRASFRLPIRLDVEVAGRPMQTWDGSPSGLAVVGDAGALRRGAEVELSLRLDDGSVVEGRGRVTSRRTVREGDLLGLSIELDESNLDRWLGQLFDGASPSADASGHRGAAIAAVPAEGRPDERGALGRWGDRVGMALVGVVSLIVLGALVLVMMGFRPLVIRSGSMVPALEVGDVVLAEQVPAREVSVGDVVTHFQSAHTGDSLTHRVRSVTATAEGLLVETKGDANPAGEEWVVHPDETVGRMWRSVPWIGAPATALRSSAVQLVIAALVVVLIALAVVRARAGRPERVLAPDPARAAVTPPSAR